MRKKKMTLKQKKIMHKDTFNSTSSSKYALKKRRQKRGVFSTNSPIKAEEAIIPQKEVKPLNLKDLELHE